MQLTRMERESNKNIFMDYIRCESESIFKPQKRLDELIGKDKERRTDLIRWPERWQRKVMFFYFWRYAVEKFSVKKLRIKFKNYSNVIKALFEFSFKDLFVIRNTHSGMITANFLLPMAFRIENNKIGAKGDFAVPLTEPCCIRC